MAITFDCPHCQKSLTTGDDKAGLTAKCPGCGESIRVPEPFGLTSSDSGIDDVEEVSDSDAESSGPPAEKDVRNCPMCGAEIKVNTSRCPTCGEPLKDRRTRSGLPQSLELGRTMSLAWDIFKAHLPVTVGAVFITQICLIVCVYGAMVCVATFLAWFEEQDTVLITISAVAGAFAAASFLVMAFLGPGYAKVLLNAVRGEEYTFGTLFSCGRYFLPNLLASTLFLVAVGFGLAACVVPGVMMALMWWAYQFILIDEDASGVSCLSRSKELMTGRWADVFLIGLIGGLLNFAISSACCVAGVFSQAFVGILLAVVYVKLRGETTVIERPHARPSRRGDIDDEVDERED